MRRGLFADTHCIMCIYWLTCSSLLSPCCIQEKSLDEMGSDTLTRIGGAAILNAGASHLVAGLSNNAGRNKQHLQIAAGQFAILAGISGYQWRTGKGQMRKDRVKSFTTVAAVTAALCAWRGFTSNPDNMTRTA